MINKARLRGKVLYVDSHYCVMPNITLSVPNEVYEKMKKYKEVKWSEVVRRAILEYLRKLEEGGLVMTTRELLDMLGSEFEEKLDRISLEDFEKAYEKMKEEEMKRPSVI